MENAKYITREKVMHVSADNPLFSPVPFSYIKNRTGLYCTINT